MQYTEAVLDILAEESGEESCILWSPICQVCAGVVLCATPRVVAGARWLTGPQLNSTVVLVAEVPSRCSGIVRLEVATWLVERLFVGCCRVGRRGVVGRFGLRDRRHRDGAGGRPAVKFGGSRR